MTTLYHFNPLLCGALRNALTNDTVQNATESTLDTCSHISAYTLATCKYENFAVKSQKSIYYQNLLIFILTSQISMFDI